jgi:hypothetical protein
LDSRKTAFLVSGSRQDDNLQAIVYAQTLSGPVQESTPSPRGLTQLSLRISRQFTSNHAMFWQYNDREYPGHNLGVGGLTLPEAGTTPDHWEREFVVNHKLSLTPRLVNQFQALVGREHPELSSRRQQLLAPTGFRLCARGQEDRAPRRRRRVLRPHRGRTVGGLGFLCNKSRSNCPSCACRLGTFRPP